MGIFDRIFKREEKEERPPLRSMSLSDIDAWAEETSSNIQEDLVSEMQPAVEEILELKEGACEIVEEIRDYKPPAEIKKRMFKPVITAKPKYVKGMLDGFGHIRSKETDAYGAIVDFNSRVARALKIIHKTQLSQGPMIATFFQEEMPRLGTALNRIMDLHKSIEEGIKDGEEREKRASAIKTAVAELRRVIDEAERLKEEASGAQKEIDALEAKQAGHKEELERLHRSKDYRKLEKTETKLAKVQEKRVAVESKGGSLLGSLLRVLRKYARVAADKDTKRVTESYIKDSRTAFFEEADSATTIERILNEVRAMSERGELSLSKKEREKVDNALSQLDSIKEQHTSIKEEEKLLKDVLASSVTRKEEANITEELKRVEDDIKKLHTEAEDTKSDSKKQEIEKLKKQLEKSLSEERETDVAIEI